jgi:hypothetical protein
VRCLFWRVPFAEPGVEAHAGNCPHHVCIVEARRRKVAEKVQRGPGHAEQAAQEDGASHGGVTVVSVARTMVRATFVNFVSAAPGVPNRNPNTDKCQCVSLIRNTNRDDIMRTRVFP